MRPAAPLAGARARLMAVVAQGNRSVHDAVKEVESDHAQMTAMTADRPACHAADSPIDVERQTCNQVRVVHFLEGRSPGIAHGVFGLRIAKSDARDLVGRIGGDITMGSQGVGVRRLCSRRTRRGSTGSEEVPYEADASAGWMDPRSLPPFDPHVSAPCSPWPPWLWSRRWPG